MYKKKLDSYSVSFNLPTLSPFIKLFYATKPLLHSLLLPSPHIFPYPHHLHLSSPFSNCWHTVQGAHGLDGKPGQVVSGRRPVFLTSSLLSCSFHLPTVFLSPQPACHWLSRCRNFCLPACPTLLVSIFPVLFFG